MRLPEMTARYLRNLLIGDMFDFPKNPASPVTRTLYFFCENIIYLYNKFQPAKKQKNMRKEMYLIRGNAKKITGIKSFLDYKRIETYLAVEYHIVS
jgi:hypothetical protein